MAPGSSGPGRGHVADALAGLAAAQGDLERAAELAGARDALREQIGVFLPPIYPAGYERTFQAARADLSSAAFDAAHARAAGLAPPQIIAMALDDLASAPQEVLLAEEPHHGGGVGG
jgi:hypothetical protein